MTDDLKAGRRAQKFVQVPEWVMLAELTPQAKSLYTLLLAHVNSKRDDHLAWPGMDTMAQIMGFKNRNPIVRYLKELKELGAIDSRAVPSPRGRRNVYTVHETPPDGYQGPMSLADFYDRRKAAAPPAGDAVPGAGAAPPRIVAGQMASHPERCNGSHSERCDGSHPDRYQNQTNTNQTKNNQTNLSGHADARPNMDWLTEDNPNLIEDIERYVEEQVGLTHRTDALVQAMSMDGYEPLHILNSALKDARTGDVT